MVSFTALAASDDDDDSGLTEEQQVAMIRAVSSPTFTASLDRARQQIAAAASLNGHFARVISTQLGAALAASQAQASVAAAVQAGLQRQLDSRRVLEPLIAQMAQQQRQLAASLAVSLANSREHTDVAVLAPDLTAALQRINEVSLARFELPDPDGLDRLSDLIETGEVEASTLEAAEAGVSSDADLSAAIDEAATVLARERPWLSRARARQIVVVWVWVMWTASVVAIAVAAPPIVDTIAGAAGLAGSRDAARWAGEKFDKKFPPEEPVDD